VIPGGLAGGVRKFQLALLLSVSIINAQDSVFTEPVMGWIFDGRSTAVKPLRGIPGAATIGAAVPGPAALRNAAIAPDGQYILAATADETYLTVPGSDPRPLEIGFLGTDQISLSPTGRSAAVLSTSAKKVAVISGLPNAARVDRILALDTDATIADFAISDDTSTLAVAADVLLVYPHEGQPNIIPSASRPSAIAFLPGAGDLAVVSREGRSVHLIRDIAGAAEQHLLAQGTDGLSAPSAVRFTNDARRMIISDEAGVLVLTLDDRSLQRIECACRPDTLQQLSSSGIYRITRDESQPLWLLVLDPQASRTVFVPPGQE
jgi:hypothetical protein